MACVETASKALALDPDNSRFKDIREQAQTELEKSHQQEELAAAATSQLENQDYEAAQKTAAEGLQLDLNRGRLREIPKLAEEGIAEWERAVKRPPRRKLVFLAAAASAVLAVALYFSLREEALRVDGETATTSDTLKTLLGVSPTATAAATTSPDAAETLLELPPMTIPSATALPDTPEPSLEASPTKTSPLGEDEPELAAAERANLAEVLKLLGKLEEAYGRLPKARLDGDERDPFPASWG